MSLALKRIFHVFGMHAEAQLQEQPPVTYAFAPLQLLLAADVHRVMMLSFGCFLPIVQ